MKVNCVKSDTVKHIEVFSLFSEDYINLSEQPVGLFADYDRFFYFYCCCFLFLNISSIFFFIFVFFQILQMKGNII